MINLDARYQDYLQGSSKKFRIDGIEERVKGYGYTDNGKDIDCLLYTSPSPRDATLSRMPSSA